MILNDDDAEALWRWPHFSPAEFKNRGSDGPHLKVETEFMDRLERVRVELDRPMLVTSGYRTPEYNSKVSTTGRTGPHTTGRACDVSISGPDALRLVQIALAAGFTGIGVNQKGAHRFIHLDDLRNGYGIPRPWIWSY